MGGSSPPRPVCSGEWRQTASDRGTDQLRRWQSAKHPRPQAALAFLKSRDAFVDTDYRVAWATWHLYRTLGDTTMATKLLQQAVALKGERDLSSVPVL